PGIGLLAAGQVGGQAQADGGQVRTGLGATAGQGRRAATLAEAVGVDFDMGVLDVRLQFQPAPGEAVADIDERLAAVGVVAAGQGVGVAPEGDRAVDLDFVLAAGMAQRQAEAAPRGAGIDADVGAAGLAARAAATHVEVGVAGAAEHADAPAGVEGVVDAHQHGVAAVPGPRRVAVGGDLAALVLDLHP